MPYNTSTRTIVRMRRYLDDMLALRTMRWPTNEPEVLARRIREALAAAEVHEKVYPQFKELKAWFRLRVKKKPRPYVEAEYIGPSDEDEATLPAITGVEPTRAEFPDTVTLVEAVSIAIEKFVEHNELHFPNLNLNPNDKLTLYNWTKQELKWKYLDHEGAGITLTQKPVQEIFLWRP